MMDKPLDFSMNSCKEKTKQTPENEIEETSKGEKEVDNVCKDVVETVDDTKNGSQTGLVKHKQVQNPTMCNRMDNQNSLIKSISRFQSGSKRTHGTFANSVDTEAENDAGVPSMPPLKQMSFSNNSQPENERTEIASELLRDIMKLQSTQGVTQAKLSLEKQINALKAEHESLVNQNIRSVHDRSKWNTKSTRILEQNSNETGQHPSVLSSSTSLTDIELVDTTKCKEGLEDTRDVKECMTAANCSSPNFKENIFFQQKSLGNQPFQSLQNTMISSAPNLLTDDRTEPTVPTTIPQQQQAPVSSELHRVNQESLRNYAAFRDNMLRHFAMTKMRRRQSAANSLDNEEDDDCNYVERRKKNNEAAKRSRDARRAKEDEVSIRAAFLEQENIQLKWDVTKLRAEVAKIRAYVIAEAAIDFQLQQQNQHSIVDEKDVS